MSGVIIFHVAIVVMIVISLVALMLLIFLGRRIAEHEWLTEADLISIEKDQQ